MQMDNIANAHSAFQNQLIGSQTTCDMFVRKLEVVQKQFEQIDLEGQLKRLTQGAKWLACKNMSPAHSDFAKTEDHNHWLGSILVCQTIDFLIN